MLVPHSYEPEAEDTSPSYDLGVNYTDIPIRPGLEIPDHIPFWKTLSKEDRSKYDQKLTLDGTGAYHWREPCALDDVTMVSTLHVHAWLDYVTMVSTLHEDAVVLSLAMFNVDPCICGGSLYTFLYSLIEFENSARNMMYIVQSSRIFSVI